MADMRDRVIALKGKKLCVVYLDSGKIVITPPYGDGKFWYDEITEVGKDYFIVKRSDLKRGNNALGPITYAISAITKISA